MIRFVLLISVVTLFTSCISFNRLTSPKPVPEKTTQWDFGGTVDPMRFNQDVFIAGVEPVVGFRRGISSRTDIGLRMHGLYIPQLVFDFKHVFIHRGDFYLSGDLAVMGMVGRSIGPQYDLIFGTELIYGTFGVNYDFAQWEGDAFLFHGGFGGKPEPLSRMGWQFNFGMRQRQGSDQLDPVVRLGIVYNLVPKRYRD